MKLLTIIVAVGFLNMNNAFSDSKNEVPLRGTYLETLTWKEAEEKFKKTEVVIIPVGARTKEHGLHLPLNNDWIMAEYLTRRVLEKSPHLAIPTIEYGYYPAFLEYPGSISLGKDTFRDSVADICRSLTPYGPKKFYVLNTGVSTNWSLEPARQLLEKEGITMEYTDLLSINDEAEKKVQQQTVGTHADELETSMMLYIAPQIVHMNLAQKDIHGDRPGPLSRDPETKTGVYSPTGAWGDPTLATREKGKILVEALVSQILSFLDQFQDKSYQVAPPRTRYLK